MNVAKGKEQKGQIVQSAAVGGRMLGQCGCKDGYILGKVQVSGRSDPVCCDAFHCD